MRQRQPSLTVRGARLVRDTHHHPPNRRSDSEQHCPEKYLQQTTLQRRLSSVPRPGRGGRRHVTASRRSRDRGARSGICRPLEVAGVRRTDERRRLSPRRVTFHRAASRQSSPPPLKARPSPLKAPRPADQVDARDAQTTARVGQARQRPRSRLAGEAR